MKNLIIYLFLLVLFTSLNAQNTENILLKEILNKNFKENFSKTPKGEEFFQSH